MYTKLLETECCAVLHLTADNKTTAKDIEQEINDYIILKTPRIEDRETTIVCYTTPRETKLEAVLLACQFKHLTTIKRRIVCGKGELKMWIKTLDWNK